MKEQMGHKVNTPKAIRIKALLFIGITTCAFMTLFTTYARTTSQYYFFFRKNKYYGIDSESQRASLSEVISAERVRKLPEILKLFGHSVTVWSGSAFWLDS